MKFVQTIQQNIIQQHLLEKDKKYLVALSGGADSVALLLVLHELGYTVEACHCNFHLRGEESDRDERFCVTLCQQLNIELHRIHFDTRTYAKLHNESIELAARNLRYRFFDQLRKDVDAAGICVAHHQDDNVETILINLVRGTGLKGLTGISPVNGYIIRPFLCITRQDILDYLTERQQNFVTDSSNLVDDVVRNKIRLNIIPMLKEINPAVCHNIAATARYLTEASKMLTAALEKEKEQIYQEIPASFCMPQPVIRISKSWLLNQASTEYALFHTLSPYGASGKMIQEILLSINSTGKTWQTPTHQILIDRELILIKENKEDDFRKILIPEPGCYVTAIGKIRISKETVTEDFQPSKEKHLITLEARNIKFPLMLRRTQQGDAFIPFGMKGRKLVSDYLTDRKRNLFEKQSQLILADSAGNILWVVGERTSDDFRIKHTTETILKIEIVQD